MTTQEQARADKERADRERGKSPGKVEMEDLGKTSRTPDEIKRDVERGRDRGEPATTQQIPVTPAPISQEELERIEDEKRQKNREVQYPAAERSEDDGNAQKP